ncbi:class F sortase [Frankia sp. AiPa1]|uniref:class F sortase n=1 Tax=Frankia sp. AiPa1 TaxID=573492 RepID=UPI00202AEB2A|nr:class F sortase [Frankia sp. AiPa1]MCL9762499.1 class F sortase [Frankia sp. AiPa1]
MIVTAVLLGVVGVTGLTGWMTSRPPADTGSLDAGTAATGSPGAHASPGAAGAGQRAGQSGPPATPADESARPAAARAQRPTTLSVSDVRISAPIVTSLVDGSGALEVPRDPATVGWWAGGAAPGSPAGTVVLAGHVDYNGRPGALFPLDTVPMATVVTLTSIDGTSHSYRVVARRHVAKTALATTGVFQTDGPPRLALITCGGPFDRATHSYRDNLIVLALPS